MPKMLLVPCLGFGPGGVRLGYGGGFFDRTLAALQPRRFTVGVSYTQREPCHEPPSGQGQT